MYADLKGQVQGLGPDTTAVMWVVPKIKVPFCSSKDTGDLEPKGVHNFEKPLTLYSPI